MGSLYHPDHMARAVHGRCKVHLTDLPEGYKMHSPQLSTITNIESRQPGKAPNFGINWLAHDSGLEVIRCDTGKTDKGLPSRLCKNDMYKRFSKIWHRMEPSTRCSSTIPATYHDTKHAVVSYQMAKEQLYTAMAQHGMGQWIKKPPEQDQFQIENCSGQCLRLPGVPMLHNS